MSKKIKVAHVCSTAASIKYLLSDQLRYLEDRGFEMHAISSPGDYVDELRAMNFRWHPARIVRRISPIDDLKGILEVRQLCRREKFDIVHTHTPKGVLIGQYGARLARTPIVMQTLHGFYYIGRESPVFRRLVRMIEVQGCRTAAHVLSQSPEDVDRMGRERMCDISKVSYLGNGINVDRFTVSTWSDEERARRRTALGLNAEGPIIGIVGRFVIEKGYRELCEALRGLAKTYPTIQVLAIGTRPSIERSEELVAVADDPENGHRFVCLYDRDDMEGLYKLMDLFILPSYREGFPRAPMEASATGLAVVTTDVRGCRQAVTDGDNGLIIPPKDAGALQTAIDRLLADPDLMAKMGRRGRQRAEEEFDQRIVFERVAACYERLLRERGLWPN